MLVSDPLQKMVSPLLATDHALTRLGPIEQHRHGPVAGWSDADEPYLFEEPLALGRSSNAASCAGVGPVKHPSLCFWELYDFLFFSVFSRSRASASARRRAPTPRRSPPHWILRRNWMRETEPCSGGHPSSYA